MAGSSLVIGVDFDNTIAIYDSLMHRIALGQGLIDSSVPKVKQQIRDTVRMLPNGENHWQKIQGAAYGPRMGEALPAEGFAEFVMGCREQKAPVYIVSHKTVYANYDDTHSKLRTKALAWMESQGFFSINVLGFSPNAVFFEATRQEKLDRIRQLGCTHFIDDLRETFDEEAFPKGVGKILYRPVSSGPNPGLESISEVSIMSSWTAVGGHLFAARS